MEEKVIKGLLVRRSKMYPNYGTSRCGKAFRWDREKPMKVGFLTGGEYETFRTSHNGKAKSVYIHVVLAECWIENTDPDLFVDVNHIDGVKTNYNIDNLEWVSKSQNQRHALETGLRSSSVKLYNASFKCEEDIHEACKMLVEGIKPKEISSKFSVSSDVVNKLRDGSTYFHIRNKYDIKHTYRNNYTEEFVIKVCNMLVAGYADFPISRELGLVVVDVRRIRHKTRYKEISDLFF